MTSGRARSAGGEKLLNKHVVAELRSSRAIEEFVGEMRQREASLARSLGNSDPSCVQLACQACITEMLGGDKPSAASSAMDASTFAQAVFALRGLPKTALRRREARETARSYARLNAGEAIVPQCVHDFQTLWEMAMEGEPRLNKEFPSSELRTGDSFIIDGQNPDECLRMNAKPENIVDELEELVVFLQDDSLLAEVRGTAAYASCMLTHPFDDGNGHTGRMLMLFTMAQNYSLLTNTCFSRTLAQRREDLGNAVQMIYEGTSTLAEFCLSALELLQGAQSEAASLLKSVQLRS